MGNKPSATAKTEAPGGANSRSRKRSSAQERQKISAARKTRHETAHLKRKAVRELSCAATNRATQRRLLASDGAVGLDKDKAAEKEKQLGHELAEHLKSIAPFNKRWHVTDTISEGAYGVVFAVKDEKTGTSGVIKVAKAKDVGDATNQTAEWEGYVLERMFRQSPEASVVRLLDKGMLADQYGQGMEFMVLEKAELRIRDYIDDGKTAKEKRLRTTKVMLQMLKSIIDLHTQGFLHRDLKPDNMGIMSNESPIALLFDLGMARMYTDGEAHVRQPRTSVAFRGTPEWASGHAQKCREQTRYDDLVAWLYCAVELYAYAECPQTDQPLPWTYRGNPKAVRYLKSVFCPARLLLRVCPQQFYSINTYLCMTNRFKTPDYGFIVEKVQEMTVSRFSIVALVLLSLASAVLAEVSCDGDKCPVKRTTPGNPTLFKLTRRMGFNDFVEMTCDNDMADHGHLPNDWTMKFRVMGSKKPQSTGKNGDDPVDWYTFEASVEEIYTRKKNGARKTEEQGTEPRQPRKTYKAVNQHFTPKCDGDSVSVSINLFQVFFAKPSGDKCKILPEITEYIDHIEIQADNIPDDFSCYLSVEFQTSKVPNEPPKDIATDIDFQHKFKEEICNVVNSYMCHQLSDMVPTTALPPITNATSPPTEKHSASTNASTTETSSTPMLANVTSSATPTNVTTTTTETSESIIASANMDSGMSRKWKFLVLGNLAIFLTPLLLTGSLIAEAQVDGLPSNEKSVSLMTKQDYPVAPQMAGSVQ
ncbi:hypothetical protein QR680_012424 [Steinernema hermaphroditum]|uniref:Protein kinase domain-containing protein n=1 Tax=Steinernema hermaphroditum TaxID=289476 RepID=A0AA39I3K7_9BILA|nr:hypothetical protein QR680_012424 [Steinernema hermaphroditum]